MDSLPLNIHHMPHQNLPLLHFAPVKNEHPPPFFQDNKSRLPCHQKHRWSRLRWGKFLFSVVSHSESENTTRQWGNGGASLIQLNPRHYYSNEPNLAHLIFTEIWCWPEWFNWPRTDTYLLEKCRSTLQRSEFIDTAKLKLPFSLPVEIFLHVYKKLMIHVETVAPKIMVPTRLCNKLIYWIDG